jgi:hypothetical protein
MRWEGGTGGKARSVKLIRERDSFRAMEGQTGCPTLPATDQA